MKLYFTIDHNHSDAAVSTAAHLSAHQIESLIDTIKDHIAWSAEFPGATGHRAVWFDSDDHDPHVLEQDWPHPSGAKILRVGVLDRADSSRSVATYVRPEDLAPFRILLYLAKEATLTPSCVTAILTATADRAIEIDRCLIIHHNPRLPAVAWLKPVQKRKKA